MSKDELSGNRMDDLIDLSRELFDRTRIPFEKEREEVWKNLIRGHPLEFSPFGKQLN